MAVIQATKNDVDLLARLIRAEANAFTRHRIHSGSLSLLQLVLNNGSGNGMSVVIKRIVSMRLLHLNVQDFIEA